MHAGLTGGLCYTQHLYEVVCVLACIQDSREGYPAPNAYDVQEAHTALQTAQIPITMAPRYPEPYMNEKRPGPGAYNPQFQPKETPAASLKFRCVCV